MFDAKLGFFLRNAYARGSVLILLGFLAGVFIGQFIFTGVAATPCVSSLHLIRPNIDCDISDQKSQNLSDLQDKLSVLIDGYQKTLKARRISVFVRDLKSNRFAGLNQGDVYYMASLLKTPLIIAGYKLAEVEPKILDQELVYTGTPNLYDEQFIKPDKILAAGSAYSVHELMRRAVIYSDNTAAQLLFDYYPKEFLDRILQALGIQLKRPTGESENLITAQTYSNVFRLLYNTSYLTPEYSNEALKMLTETTYDKGAIAKLPSSVVVAHKFAERTTLDPSDKNTILRQLHECGIVYARDGKEPYSFCIMTEGSDYSELDKIIQDISLEIYNSILIQTDE